MQDFTNNHQEHAVALLGGALTTSI